VRPEVGREYLVVFGHLVIDVRHRLAKALAEERANNNGIYLNQEETASIRVI
jgi:hypothetical protein